MYLCYNIRWETDGHEVDLPKRVIADISDKDVCHTDPQEVADVLSDYLSDTFGWLHNGFEYEPILDLTF